MAQATPITVATKAVIQSAVQNARDKSDKQYDKELLARRAENKKPNQTPTGEPKGIGANERKQAVEAKKIKTNDTAQTKNPVAVQTQKGQNINQRY